MGRLCLHATYSTKSWYQLRKKSECKQNRFNWHSYVSIGIFILSIWIVLGILIIHCPHFFWIIFLLSSKWSEDTLDY
jgi:hypothetical protein